MTNSSLPGGPPERLFGVRALGVFFAAGALISFTSLVSLLRPGSVLEPMWRLNPRARQAFAGMGVWGIVLLAVVCAACALSAAGLWRLERWGRRLAIAVLSVNLAGDLANTILGTERRAAVGIPIAAALIAYLMSRRVKDSFRREPAPEGAATRPAI